MIESMTKYMAATLKVGGPETSKAIKRAENPAYVEPDEPTGDNTTRKETMLFERKYQQFLKKQETWEENSGKIFKKLSSHCSPTMKTKLCGMEGWAEVEDTQGGIKMIKLLHRVYFDTDGSRQSMREMVLDNKKMYLYFQKKEWTLDKYTRDFLARDEVCEEIRSTPGKCLESA